jgi:hypothetical protein
VLSPIEVAAACDGLETRRCANSTLYRTLSRGERRASGDEVSARFLPMSHLSIAFIVPGAAAIVPGAAAPALFAIRPRDPANAAMSW